jgi:hypothetical protein
MKPRRRPDKSPFRMAAAIFGGVLVIVLFPLYIPIVSYLVRRDEKRKLALAERFICPQCRQVLGAEALRLADERWAEHMTELHRRWPEAVRWRIVRTLDAICPHCGAQYQFAPKEIAFAPTRLHELR